MCSHAHVMVHVTANSEQANVTTCCVQNALEHVFSVPTLRSHAVMYPY